MGLYNKLEASAQKREFRSYEERIPEIKRCIEVYKEKLQEEPTEQINQKISYCLENGIEGLEYYFKDLLESELLDEKDKEIFSSFLGAIFSHLAYKVVSSSRIALL